MRLLTREDQPSPQSALHILLAHLEQDAEVRWLAGVHEAAGKTYFVKEPFEQLLWWIQLPKFTTTEAFAAKSTVLTDAVDQAENGSAAALAAGYDYTKLLANAKPQVETSSSPRGSKKEPVQPAKKKTAQKPSPSALIEAAVLVPDGVLPKSVSKRAASPTPSATKSTSKKSSRGSTKPTESKQPKQ